MSKTNSQQEEQFQTEMLFPSSIYSVNKPEYLETALKVFDEQIEIVKKEKEMDELYPHYMTRTFLDPRLEDFNFYILNSAWNILDSQGYKMDDKHTYFESLWGQEHYKYSNMEQHVHSQDTQIVGFYFLECPERSPNLIVHDPRPGKCQINLEQKNEKDATEGSIMINYKPKPGALWFTNSWLPHSFAKHGGDSPFKLIHFNIAVQKNMPPQSVTPNTNVEII